jgi:hypothetical protein
VGDRRAAVRLTHAYRARAPRIVGARACSHLNPVPVYRALGLWRTNQYLPLKESHMQTILLAEENDATRAFLAVI